MNALKILKIAAMPLAAIAAAGAQSLVPRDLIWQNNFETNLAGDSTGASPAVIGGFRFGYPGGIVRDSATLAPFGEANQYLELSPRNVDSRFGYRAIVNGVLKASYTATPVGMSYDFNESSDPGNSTIIGIGTGAADSNPDVNNTLGLFSLQFKNGSITLGGVTSLVSVGDPVADPQVLPAFVEGVAYRATWIVNFTDASHQLRGPDGADFTLDPMQGAFWLFDPVANSFTPRVIVQNNNSRVLDAHVSFVFRHFSVPDISNTELMQTIYVDNLSATTFGEAPKRWSGGGADALWSSVGNWQGGSAPQTDDVLLFGGEVNTAPNNDLTADTALAELLFQDTSSTFTLGGNRVVLTERIANFSLLSQNVEMPLLTDATPLSVDTLTAGATLALKGAISGSGDLQKKGAGILELSGVHSFSGSKTIDQGEIVVLNDQSASTGSWHARGYGATGTTLGNAATTVTFGEDAAIQIASGNFVQAGHTSPSGGTQPQRLVSSAAVTNSGTLFLGRSGTLTLDGGTWAQDGAASVATQGGGLATLNLNSGTFTYGNPADFILSTSISNNIRTRLNLNGGTFVTGSPIHNPQANLSPTDSAFSDVILANGGTLRLSAEIADLFTTAGANIRFLANNGGGTIDTNGFTTTLNVPITGNAGLTKAGLGTLTTTGTNAYLGDTIVSGGTLVLSSEGLADESAVSIAPQSKLSLAFTGTDTIGALTLGNSGPLPDGIYDANTHPDFLMGSGQLVVFAPVETFATWAADLGLAGNPDADFDLDGLGDGLEFVFGTDPKSSTAGNLITTESVGDNFIVTFIRDDRSKTSDLALSVEAGETLGAWPQSFTVGETTGTSTTPGVTVTANGNGTDTVTVAIPKNGASKLFTRIKVVVASE